MPLALFADRDLRQSRLHVAVVDDPRRADCCSLYGMVSIIFGYIVTTKSAKSMSEDYAC